MSLPTVSHSLSGPLPSSLCTGPQSDTSVHSCSSLAFTDSTSTPSLSSSNSRPSKTTQLNIRLTTSALINYQGRISGISSAPTLDPNLYYATSEFTTFGTLSCTFSPLRSGNGARNTLSSAKTFSSYQRVRTEMQKLYISYWPICTI